MKWHVIVLVISDHQNKIPQTVWQEFIPQSFGDWKSQNKVPGGSVSDEGSFFGLQTTIFLLHPYMAFFWCVVCADGERKKLVLWCFFYKGTNSIMRVPPSWPHLNLMIFQRPYLQPPNAITLGDEVSTNEFGGWVVRHTTHSIAVTLLEQRMTNGKKRRNVNNSQLSYTHIHTSLSTLPSNPSQHF